MAGGNFDKAKKDKKDEFYTHYTDVVNELNHYKVHFKDKIVFCNCDNPARSSFWKYFHLNFTELGLKKLVSTYYEHNIPAYKTVYEGGNDNDIKAGEITPLKCDGDFRSPECIELLNEADLIVTNPPFSLFREYIVQLMEYKKKFIVWGNINSITYKEVFPLLKNGQIWVGYIFNRTCIFQVGENYNHDEKITRQINDGYKYSKVPGILTFTNLYIQKCREKLVLCKLYNPDRYTVFDELPNIINVDRIADIPIDYPGMIAVPITFINKFNPEQFEIIDGLNRYTILDSFGINEDVRRRHSHCCNINGKSTYYRIVIRKKNSKTIQS